MAMTTTLLALLALGAVVAVVGVETTKSAATTAGSKTKSLADTTAGWGIAGALGGLQLGGELAAMFVMEPFAFTTIIAGVAGALGIEGMLGGISGLQFALIGVTVTAAVAYWRY